MADGDLTLLATLFSKAQDVVGPVVFEVPTPQPRNGSDPGPGVGEGAEQRPIARADDVGGVDGAEQVLGLLVGKPGVFPSEVSCFLPRTDWKGLSGAAWRVTRVSKKCVRAASGWFLVVLSSMKRPARPGETRENSRCSSSHRVRNRLTTRT